MCVSERQREREIEVERQINTISVHAREKETDRHTDRESIRVSVCGGR